MRTLAACALLLFSLNCGTGAHDDPVAPTQQRSVDQTVDLAFSRSVTIGSLQLRFANVEDSRCPSAVQCFWAGDGAVTLDVTMNGQMQQITVHTAGKPSYPKSATVGPYDVTLDDLRPQPVHGPAEKRDYVARLHVTH